MRSSADLPLRVRVHCSTSNVGPGFDCLGLSLALYLEVELEGHCGGDRHELGRTEGEAARWPREENLLFRAFDAIVGTGGSTKCGYRFHAHSEIPLARGLGSSGAAVAAGLLLGNALAERALPVEELCRIGAEIEGHPDNSTASLLGGCTLGARVAGRLAIVRPELHPSLRFAVAWPAEPIATARARAALPSSVPFADATENARRLALLLEGLRRGDPELLTLGGEDRLHVPYRLPLIRGAARSLELAREAGAWLATISGSGSALFAISGEERIGAVATALAAGLESERVERRVLDPVVEPPRVRAMR